MQNNKNSDLLVFEDDTNTSTNSHSCRSSNPINSAPNDIQTLNVDPGVFKNDTPELSSILKRLLLDEDLRENFLKGGSTLTSFNNSDNKPSFFVNSKIYLPYAEQLVLEVCI